MPKSREVPVHAAHFQGLADETRLRILEILRSGEHCVCELTEQLELGQSLLSFHLKTLKRAGLVTDRRQGRWTYYSLDETGVRDLIGALKALTKGSRTRRERGCD